MAARRGSPPRVALTPVAPLAHRGRSNPLRSYHNDVKRWMISTVAARSRATSLLDLCCGRGGDINKWVDARLAVVHGVDISDEEIAEARRRFAARQQAEWERRGRRLPTHCTFATTDGLGVARVPWDRQYDAVTCMFSAHYFFLSATMIDNFLGNVSAGLRDGGCVVRPATPPPGRRGGGGRR